MTGDLGPDEILRRFGYHPATELTAEQHDAVRFLMIATAETLDAILPRGREKACAMTALQEAAMWSNAAVAMQAPVQRPTVRSGTQTPAEG